MRRLLLLSVLFAVRLQAQDAAAVAALVHGDAVDAAAIEKAMQSPDAVVRATAARVAMVRGVPIVPALRKQLESEKSPEAARELVRAIVILGDGKDVAAVVPQLAAFPASIETAFVDALARTGRDADRYLHKLRAVPLPRAFQTNPNAQPSRPPGVSTPVNEPGFALPLVLPRGLAAQILSANRCKSGWVGVLEVTRDSAGRVQSADTKGVLADRGCIDALRTIARLSLAEAGPAGQTPLLVVRVPDAPPCFDEAAVTDAIVNPEAGGKVVAPKVLKRVEPRYPESVRRQDGGAFSVAAEATITSEGCVRDIRLVRQTIYPELNRAAIEALAKWTFAPGTLNGVPVDVLFNLTLTFRH